VIAARPGRDRHAVRHAAPGGERDAGLLPRRPHVVVIGGGIAGLAAATGLAERGVRVTLLERERQLGGRVAGWTETMADGTPLPMSRGFHAFFRQYYNLRALLRRTDPALSRLVPVPDYPLVDAAGRRDSFRGLPRTPPWNALAFALRSPTFRLRDLLALDAAAAAPLAAVSVPAIYDRLDDMDAETFLRRVNFPVAARHLAFDVFSRSFFAEPSRLSAAELAAMFHIYFLGSSEGLMFDVPDAGFDAALWDPLAGYLTGAGVEIRTSTAVASIDFQGPGAFRVHERDGGTLTADGVVLAADVAGLRQIVESSPSLAQPGWQAEVAGLRSAPPFLVRRLWLDRAVRAERPAFLAVGGRPPLDNISVLERYDGQARHWAARTGGSVVELHAYAARDQDAGERAVAALYELYPETRQAAIVADSVLWRSDCPLFGPGDFARRPRVRTPFAGLMLAGDGIRIDVPVALMERAATTGWYAANCLLARWGLAGHELYTVPTRGRLAPLRALAERQLGLAARPPGPAARPPGPAAHQPGPAELQGKASRR
jgi:isorenieratene synthase